MFFFKGEEVAYSKTYTKDPMRGYNHFLGSPEITNQAFDPGFKSQIFQQDKWNTGYLVTPSLICDVASSTTEVSDESTYKKSESSRSGSGGGFDLMGATVGGASSSASSNSYGKNSYSEKVSTKVITLIYHWDTFLRNETSLGNHKKI